MNRATPTVLISLLLLAGCTVLPGGSVPLKQDAPAAGWTESKLREVYGAPQWVGPAPDGGKLLYFTYKSAPDSKALAVATAITTFGLVTDAGSLDFQLIAVVDGAGQFVCADRVRINYGDSVQCEHDLRLKIRESLSGQQRRTYEAMLKQIDRQAYVPGFYEVVDAPALSGAAITAALERGGDRDLVGDDAYYAAAECYLYSRWYSQHLVAKGQDDSVADAAADRYAQYVYEAGGSRGHSRYQVDDDVSLYRPALAYQLKYWVDNAEGLARDCMQADTPSERQYSGNNIDRLIHDRVRARMNLARGLLLIDQPEVAPRPDDVFLLGLLSMSQQQPSGVIRDNLLEEKATLAGNVTIDTLADPTHGTEILLTQMIRNGELPPRRLLASMMRALEARIALGDHSGTIQVLANIGRYYLTHTADRDAMTWGVNILTDTARMADYRGDFDTSSALAFLAGEMALKDIEFTLAADELDSEAARDSVRDILSFVPYSYERTSWDGRVTRYEVSAPPFDAQGMLSLIRTLKFKHWRAAEALAYAASFDLDPEDAGRYFAALGREANEGFSSAGASRYYSLAASAFQQAGDEDGAMAYRFYASTNAVRANSAKTKDKKRSCEGDYKLFRAKFDASFDDPDLDWVEARFGADMRQQMRKFDRICKVR